MNQHTFDTLLDRQFQRCEHLLNLKAEEYATLDRLHNFKVAAELQGITPQAALAGMMAKHSVSIYDMCSSSKQHTFAVWNKKITDHINYLILLQALLVDTQAFPPQIDVDGTELIENA